MSTYADYDKTSILYDSQRRAFGADVLAAMLQFYSCKQLKDLKILDAGCGTGNYAEAFIEMGCYQMTLLDASTAMLEVAKNKLKRYIEKGAIKDVVHAMMPPIPLPDDTFDAVMFNLVLNHLDRDDPSFPNCVATLKESVRILRHGGLILITTMLKTACTKVMWFSQLNMNLTERFVEAVLHTPNQYDEMFREAGITCIQKLNILGSDVYKSYFNIDGPLDPEWRRPSAYWSFATKEEIDYVEAKVKELKARGDYVNWVKEHDHSKDRGIITVLICKPL